MAKKFSATVNGWVAESKERATAVFRQSVNDLVEEIQTPVAEGGFMPVDTGFLRASISASLNGELAPMQPRPSGDESVAYAPGEVIATIANAEVGDVITFSYGAEYAIVQENKWAFVSRGAQRWPQIVQRNAKAAERMAK